MHTGCMLSRGGGLFLPGGVCPGGCLLRGVYTPRADILPMNRITNRCKNITFPQLRLRTATRLIPHTHTHTHRHTQRERPNCTIRVGRVLFHFLFFIKYTQNKLKKTTWKSIRRTNKGLIKCKWYCEMCTLFSLVLIVCFYNVNTVLMHRSEAMTFKAIIKV